MKFKLISAEDTAALDFINTLYISAFPEIERKPFSLILKKRASGCADILCITDEDGRFVGEAIVLRAGQLALIDYFAVDPECRNRGIGSAALELLREKYNGMNLILEIEAADIPCENVDQRIKRRNFYLRNSLTPMDYRVEIKGEEMEVLTFSDPVFFDDYFKIYESIFGGEVSHIVRLKQS